jgi:hypothetical protein
MVASSVAYVQSTLLLGLVISKLVDEVKLNF